MSPVVEEPEEFCEELVEQAKEYLKEQYEASLVSTSTQSDQSWEDVRVSDVGEEEESEGELDDTSSWSESSSDSL